MRLKYDIPYGNNSLNIALDNYAISRENLANFEETNKYSDKINLMEIKKNFDIITDSNINITADQMNIGYDSDIDETAPTANKYLSNYTYVGANSLTDLSDPTFVLYPNAIY